MQELALQHKKNEIMGWMDSCLTKAKNQRAVFERQWFINLAFYAGKQYVSPINMPGYGFRLTSPKAPAHRVRLVINLIRKAVRKEVAKLTNTKPIPTVVPATNEDEDQTAAVVSEKVLKAQFANGRFNQDYLLWIWWGVVTGASFMKSYYDPSEDDYDAMRVPEIPPDLAPLMQYLPPQVQQKMQTPTPTKGKVCYSVVTPFNIFVPDLMLPNIQDQPWVIHTQTRSPEWVKKKFGIDAACDARTTTTTLDAATIIAKGENGALMDAVLVKEMWIKPSAHKNFPDGGLVTVCGGRVVQYLESWPLPFPDYPFYQYRGLPSGGFYDDSVVVDLIAPQKEYNKTRSQMIEIKNVMGKPKLLYEKGSINPRMISSETGQSIPYVPGFNPPTVMPATEYPSSMVQESQQLRDEFDDISGQHDISNGETPPGVDSGTAISFLQEQDEQGLSYQVAGIEFAIQMLGSHHLKYVTTYWDDDRIIKVTGQDNTFESITWKKHAMQGNTDVRVQAGSALPQSKAAKQALITDWMTNGFMAPDVGLEILDFGNYEKAMAEQLVDKRQAQRENLKFAEGSEPMFQVLMQPPPDQNPHQDEKGNIIVQDDDPTNPTGFKPFQPQPPIPVNSWDNHEVHIKYHNMYRKTQEFDALSEIKKQALELHVQAHQAALMYTQVNALGTQMGPAGALGGGPVPNSDGGEPPVEDGPPDENQTPYQAQSESSGDGTQEGDYIAPA